MSRKALVVASETYADTTFPTLPSVAADADALRRVLGDPEIGDFEVEILHDRPSLETKKAIERFFRSAGVDDLLLLHFSGHGTKAENGRLYFVANDTESEYLASTAIEADFVNEQMSQSRSRRILLWLDCCYSGGFTRGMRSRADGEVHIEDSFEGRGHLVMTASTAIQFAYERSIPSVPERQPSLFTGAIVAGLESGEAARPDQPKISMNDLYQYVFRTVKGEAPDQTPTLSGDKTQGELYVANNRAAAPAHGPLRRVVDEKRNFSYLVPEDWTRH